MAVTIELTGDTSQQWPTYSLFRPMTIDWQVSANLFGASQTLLLALVLLAVQQSNRYANRFLVSFLLIAALGMLARSFGFGRNPAQHPLPFLLMHLGFAMGPLLYFYARALTERTFRLNARNLWHFAPVCLMAGLFLMQLSANSTEIASSDLWSDAAVTGPVRESGWYTLIHLALLTAYSLLSLRTLASHRQNILQQFSALEQIRLGWLRTFFFASLVTYLLEAALQLIRLQADFGFQWRGPIRLTGSMTLIYFLFFMALRQRLIFADSTADNGVAGADKYQTSSLGQKAARDIWQALQELMSDEQPYLINGLKLTQLAEMLECSADHLSQTINLCGQQNFFEFVNSYRVQEATRLLEQQPELSVIDIAERSGFNSQSTFYAQFKKQHQQTPRQYRKQRQVD